MLFSKSLLVVATLATNVLAYAIVGAPLGIKGTLKHFNRPSNAKMCGKAALSKVDSTAAIIMSGNSFTGAATNYNFLKGGSLQFTAQVDATGTGKSPKAATITKNGTLAPKKISEVDQLSVSLLAGTKCAGGKDKNLCLVSFKSASGFGNCVVVRQAGAGAASAKDTTNVKTKVTGSRHPRDYVLAAEKRTYAKRAVEWVWAPTA